MHLESIISGLKQNCPRAQQQFFGSYYKKLVVTGKRYITVECDLKEIALDCIARALRNIDSFTYKSDEQFNAWVKRIMVNECARFYKRKGEWVNIGDITETSDESFHLPDYTSGMSVESIFECLADLPQSFRFIINMVGIEDLPHREAAATLEISEDASRKLLSRARKAFRDILIKKGLYDKQRAGV